MKYINTNNHLSSIFEKTGKKHTIKNIGKKTIVINYTSLNNSLIVKNKQIKPNDTITIFYQTNTFHSASHSQIQTIEIIDLPLKDKLISPEIINNTDVTTHSEIITNQQIKNNKNFIISTCIGDFLLIISLFPESIIL